MATTLYNTPKLCPNYLTIPPYFLPNDPVPSAELGQNCDTHVSNLARATLMGRRGPCTV